MIDKSALARLSQSSELGLPGATASSADWYTSATSRDWKLGIRRSPADAAWRQFAETPLAAMPVEYLTPRIEDRALEIQILLADRGLHRGPSIPDLLIAATAELAGLTVLHFDKDFDTIASVTGLSATWLTAPR